MKNLSATSDLARSYQLRLSQGGLKSKLTDLSLEVSSGIKSDIAASLRGDLSRIANIESRLSTLKTYADNMTEAKGFLSGMQSALDSLQSLASRTGTALLSDALVSSQVTLNIYLEKAPEEFKSILSTLNTSIGGRSLFSGSRTDSQAVAAYEKVIEQLKDRVEPAGTAEEIIDRIEAYFDDTVGMPNFSNNAYYGNDASANSIIIGETKTAIMPITANSHELRNVLKGFASLAYASERSDLDFSTQRSISRAAAAFISSADTEIISAQTRIGTQEEHISAELASNTSNQSALSVARGALISSDPYETAAALNEVEMNLEHLFAITARLSRLSLMDFL